MPPGIPNIGLLNGPSSSSLMAATVTSYSTEGTSPDIVLVVPLVTFNLNTSLDPTLL